MTALQKIAVAHVFGVVFGVFLHLCQPITPVFPVVCMSCLYSTSILFGKDYLLSWSASTLSLGANISFWFFIVAVMRRGLWFGLAVILFLFAVVFTIAWMCGAFLSMRDAYRQLRNKEKGDPQVTRIIFRCAIVALLLIPLSQFVRHDSSGWDVSLSHFDMKELFTGRERPSSPGRRQARASVATGREAVRPAAASGGKAPASSAPAASADRGKPESDVSRIKEQKIPAPPDVERMKSAIVGTWTGSYVAGQGITGLTFVISNTSDMTNITAEFSFYPVKENPGIPRGAFTMTGTLRPDGTLRFIPVKWLVRPNGYFYMDIELTLDSSGIRLVSAKNDVYKIDLKKAVMPTGAEATENRKTEPASPRSDSAGSSPQQEGGGLTSPVPDSTRAHPRQDDVTPVPPAPSASAPVPAGERIPASAPAPAAPPVAVSVGDAPASSAPPAPAPAAKQAPTPAPAPAAPPAVKERIINLADLEARIRRELPGTWMGTYTAGQGKTGLTFRVGRAENPGRIMAELHFYGIPENRKARTGSLVMRGSLQGDGAIRFVPEGWIFQPKGQEHADISVRLDESGILVSSGDDSHEIRLKKTAPLEDTFFSRIQ